MYKNIMFLIVFVGLIVVPQLRGQWISPREDGELNSGFNADLLDSLHASEIRKVATGQVWVNFPASGGSFVYGDTVTVDIGFEPHTITFFGHSVFQNYDGNYHRFGSWGMFSEGTMWNVGGESKANGDVFGTSSYVGAVLDFYSYSSQISRARVQVTTTMPTGFKLVGKSLNFPGASYNAYVTYRAIQ